MMDSTIHLINLYRFSYFSVIHCEKFFLFRNQIANDSETVLGAKVSYNCTGEFFFADGSTNKDAVCSDTAYWVPNTLQCARE